MKKRAPFYPCLGYCIIDANGTCVACGRPPDLGAPKGSALAKAAPSGDTPAKKSHQDQVTKPEADHHS